MMQFHVKPLIAHADTLAPLMVEAGVNTLLMGLETVSNESLADQKKRSTHEDNVKAIEICRRVGIVPYGYFVAGFETDTSDVIRAVFDFILEKRLVAQVLPIGITDVGPVGVGTESPLESLDPYSFGATIFVSSQHPQMATTELQSLLVEGYDRLFSFSRIPRMRTWKEMQYLFAYCVAYRKWRPRLLAHMRLLGAREQLTATLVDRGPTESRSGTRVKAHL